MSNDSVLGNVRKSDEHNASVQVQFLGVCVCVFSGAIWLPPRQPCVTVVLMRLLLKHSSSAGRECQHLTFLNLTAGFCSRLRGKDSKDSTVPPMDRRPHMIKASKPLILLLPCRAQERLKHC